ncbi:MAG: alpha/beta fold hydrolase [Xanthobacteraceae bacterium]
MSLLLSVLLVSGVLVVAGLVLFTAIIARAVEKAVPPLGQFIEIDGNRIHYLDKGDGPVIIMIHGLSGQLKNFTHSLFDLLTGEFRVIVVDRPGSGYSTRAPGASARLKAQGDVLAKFISAMGLKRPLLVGHSLGGAIALSVALDHPECAGGLALIAPLTQVEKTPPAPFGMLAIRSETLRRIVAWTVATPAGILTGKEKLATVFRPEAPPPDFATKGGSLLGLRPRSFYAASSDMMAVRDDLPGMIDRYPSLTLPVGILFGTDDHILSYQKHGVAMKERIATVSLELIPGGHMPTVSAARKTAEWLAAAARKLA